MAELELFGVVGETVSIKEIESPEIQIFPNPLQGHLNIEWTGQSINPVIALFDISGREVFNVIIQSTGKSAIRLNTHAYRPGQYILQKKADNAIISQKIMIE